MRGMKSLSSIIWIVLLVVIAAGQTEEQRKRLIELNQTIQSLDEKAQEIADQKKKHEAERQKILDSIAGDQFRQQYENPSGYLVMDMSDLPVVTLMVNAKPKPVRLQGLFISNQMEAQKFLKKKLASGIALVRCKDENCAWVYLYAKTDEPSLNAQLLDAGFATTLNTSAFPEARKSYIEAGEMSKIEAASPPPPSPAPSLPSETTSSSSQAGTEVQVKGYFRKDGTYVRPHTRSAPRRKP